MERRRPESEAAGGGGGRRRSRRRPEAVGGGGGRRRRRSAAEAGERWRGGGWLVRCNRGHPRARQIDIPLPPGGLRAQKFFFITTYLYSSYEKHTKTRPSTGTSYRDTEDSCPTHLTQKAPRKRKLQLGPQALCRPKAPENPAAGDRRLRPPPPTCRAKGAPTHKRFEIEPQKKRPSPRSPSVGAAP